MFDTFASRDIKNIKTVQTDTFQFISFLKTQRQS